jgi:hypothetical protein
MTSTDKTLFVIGAGCSKNYDSSGNGIPGLVPPTNNDFFKMARKVLLQAGIKEDAKAPLKEMFVSVCNRRGIKYDDGYDFLESPQLENLEEVMTDIDVGSTLFEKRYTVRDALHPYNVLVELVTFTITRALLGDPCPLHRKLAAMIKEDDVVLDFNYDLLMDEVLRLEGKLDDFSYGVNFLSVLKDEEWTRPEPEKKVTNSLLKLHGSLNWLRCTECSSEFLIRDISRRNDALDLASLKDMNCPRCSTDGGPMVRLVIPPVQTKEYNLEPYRFLWRSAAQKLKGILRIAFLGYSFSDIDFATKSLLRQIYRYTSGKNLKIHVMNPNSEAEERAKSLFPLSETPTMSKNLKEFLAYYSDWH